MKPALASLVCVSFAMVPVALCCPVGKIRIGFSTDRNVPRIGKLANSGGGKTVSNFQSLENFTERFPILGNPRRDTMLKSGPQPAQISTVRFSGSCFLLWASGFSRRTLEAHKISFRRVLQSSDFCPLTQWLISANPARSSGQQTKNAGPRIRLRFTAPK